MIADTQSRTALKRMKASAESLLAHGTVCTTAGADTVRTSDRLGDNSGGTALDTSLGPRSFTDVRLLLFI